MLKEEEGKTFFFLADYCGEKKSETVDGGSDLNFSVPLLNFLGDGEMGEEKKLCLIRISDFRGGAGNQKKYPKKDTPDIEP